jgi:Tfp pilus assembly protein PilX
MSQFSAHLVDSRHEDSARAVTFATRDGRALTGKGRKSGKPAGFVLITVLMLMMLLVIVAVGLLSLSSIRLRASAHGETAAIARANARLALQLAIGTLQTEAGPDQRITATADQLIGTDATQLYAGTKEAPSAQQDPLACG